MLCLTRKGLFKFSLINLAVSATLFVINYFFYHFVTDSGITLTFQSEPGKPFVAFMLGIFATLFLFAAAISALAALVLCDKENSNKEGK